MCIIIKATLVCLTDPHKDDSTSRMRSSNNNNNKRTLEAFDTYIFCSFMSDEDDQVLSQQGGRGGFKCSSRDYGYFISCAYGAASSGHLEFIKLVYELP